jgi:6-phosphofructokinase 1
MASSTTSENAGAESKIHRVAILFAGGPAPAANAVISTAAVSFLRNKVEVLGIKHGYSALEKFGPGRPMLEGQDYVVLDHNRLKRTRNSRGILLGTARANPGKNVQTYEDLKDKEKVAPLAAVYNALKSLKVDALISIGGDDTLKTANKLSRFQHEQLPEGHHRIRVVHVPKTIDNDYEGIDFTFGYFTAVDTLSKEIQNLLADAEATRGYFVAETMGRSAGWLAYGAAIAGEASLVISVEDVQNEGWLREEEAIHPKTGKPFTRKVMDLDQINDRILGLMNHREKEGKDFGVIVLAEGLAEYLPWEYVKDAPVDPHGHISIASVNFGKLFAKMLVEKIKEKHGKEKRITGVTLGYEARCAAPHAFDVILGSALGVGAYRGLVEKGLDEVMISIVGQMQLNYVPFDKIIDKATMKTRVRFIEHDSDFRSLARYLETYDNT